MNTHKKKQKKGAWSLFEIQEKFMIDIFLMKLTQFEKSGSTL